MFGNDTVLDRLNMLKVDFEKVAWNPFDISLAEKACIDAWQLVDWVYQEKKAENDSLTLQTFREDLYENFPNIKVLHDIANTVKHKRLDRPKVKIVATENHEGCFSPVYSMAHDISVILIHVEKDDGSIEKHGVTSLLKEAIEYWEKVLL